MVRGMYLWRRKRGGERGGKREGETERRRERERERQTGGNTDWRENLMLSNLVAQVTVYTFPRMRIHVHVIHNPLQVHVGTCTLCTIQYAIHVQCQVHL